LNVGGNGNTLSYYNSQNDGSSLNIFGSHCSLQVRIIGRVKGTV
jgi:hypothetical protein